MYRLPQSERQWSDVQVRVNVEGEQKVLSEALKDLVEKVPKDPDVGRQVAVPDHPQIGFLIESIA